MGEALTDSFPASTGWAGSVSLAALPPKARFRTGSTKAKTRPPSAGAGNPVRPPTASNTTSWRAYIIEWMAMAATPPRKKASHKGTVRELPGRAILSMLRQKTNTKAAAAKGEVSANPAPNARPRSSASAAATKAAIPARAAELASLRRSWSSSAVITDAA